MQKEIDLLIYNIGQERAIMKDLCFEEIKKEMNKTRLHGCDDILVGDVLHYPLQGITETRYSRANRILRKMWWALSAMKRAVNSEYRYDTHGKNGSLFLFSSSYSYRADHRHTFQQLKALFPQSASIIHEPGTRRFSFRKLRLLPLICRWKKDIAESTQIETWMAEFIACKLFEIYCDYDDAEQVFGKGFPGYYNLIVWCDIHPVDSFFIQRFNHLGKQTVDLMHGSISDTYNAWTVRGVKSTTFIADSLFTRDMLVRNGYLGQILICGYPNQLEHQDEKEPFTEKICGIILSAAGVHDINVKLCDRLDFVPETGYRLIGKLHPSETEQNYPTGYFRGFDTVYGTEITSASFLDRIRVAIICPSTVVFDAVSHRVPFLIIADELGLYEAYHMPEEIIVHDMEELPVKFNRMISGDYDSVYRSLIQYYTVDGNVKENYLNAFHKLGIC